MSDRTRSVDESDPTLIQTAGTKDSTVAQEASTPTASLRGATDVVAKEIAAAVRKQSMDAIRVGEFVSQSKENADFGEHIADELSEALVLQGIAIRRVAPVGIKGDFTVGINQQTGLMKVTVRGTTTDRTKAVLVAFSRSLLQNEGDLQPVNEP